MSKLRLFLIEYFLLEVIFGSVVFGKNQQNLNYHKEKLILKKIKESNTTNTRLFSRNF